MQSKKAELAMLSIVQALLLSSYVYDFD